MVRWVRGMTALLACAFAGVVAAPSASAADVYSYANGCYVLRDATSGRYVVRDALGYSTAATTVGAATPFRMQATALGRYLLYGPDGRMPSAAPLGLVGFTSAPGPAADWRLEDVGGNLRLVSVSTGKQLGVGAASRLTQVASGPARWAFVAAQGCAQFPEVEVNVTGQPFKGSSPTATVRGFLDDHIHLGAFEFLGGRFHCGRPWSPYGVTVALKDCVDHFPNGAGAVVENFISTGSPVGTHSPEGWPSFAGWPRDESQSHEGTYWKWLERAWRSGLRLMVTDLVENRALCELYPFKQNNCNEMASAYQQVKDMQALQDYIDAQFGGPGKGFFRLVSNSAEARQGDQRRQARRGARDRGVRGARLRPVQRHAEVRYRPDRPRARQALRRRRPLDVPRAQVRQRARRHEVRQRGHGRAREHGQQVRHRPVLDRRPLRRPGSRQHADPDRRPGGPADLDAVRARAHPAAVPGPAAGLSPGTALQPEGPDRPRRARDPLDDAQGDDRRDRPPEHEGAAAGPDDPRVGGLPGRDLEPLLGRPRQPEAPPAARRDRRPDLERGHRVRGRVAGRPREPRLRASSSAPGSVPTSTGSTRSPRRVRAPPRTRSPIRSAPSTAAA